MIVTPVKLNDMTFTIKPNAASETQVFGKWTENQAEFCGDLEYKLTLKKP